MGHLKATIDRFEGSKAVLILEDGQQLIIAKNELGKGLHEGAVINLTLNYNQKATRKAESLVKKTLRKILKKGRDEV